MKRKIRAKFVDFWAPPDNNAFYHYLADRYEVELSDAPDYLFYSDFGSEHHSWRYRDCVKIYYSGEPRLPRFYECDYALTLCTLDHPRSYKFPLYKLFMRDRTLTEVKPRTEAYIAEHGLLSERKFCYFLASNPHHKSKIREAFFRQLSEYKRVESGGLILNNIGRRVPPGHEEGIWRSQYKFGIAFENGSMEGYTTEKLLLTYLGGSVPIYWGNPNIGAEFNSAAFINAHDFDDFGDLIEYVKRVDGDDELYRSYIRAPIFANGKDNEFIRNETLYGHLEDILNSPKPARERRPLGTYPRLGYERAQFAALKFLLKIGVHRYLASVRRRLRSFRHRY